MKLATTTGDFGKYVTTTEEAVKYIAESGFKYIDYSFGIDLKHKTGIFSDDPDGYIEKIKALAKDLGVKFVQAHSPLGAPLVYDEKQKQLVSDTKKCIEACGKLGIDKIIVHTGYRADISKEQNFEENKAFYEELLETAEKWNVNILAENFNRMCIPGTYWVDNAPDLAEFVRFMNHPLLHACWDTGHGNMVPTPQDEALKILGGEVYALHVQDNMGDIDTHIAPYFGTMNVDALMRGLKEINYKGYFTFEACNIFTESPGNREKKSDIPLSIRIEAEKFLYNLGKTILMQYDCFEE